jgi:plastocyanin
MAFDPGPNCWRTEKMLAPAQAPRRVYGALTWLTAGLTAALLLTGALLAASQTRAAETVAVDISDFAFKPGTVTIQVGDTVTWTNNDSVAHTATSVDDPEAFEGKMDPGESFSFTFSDAGTFDYFCEIHPDMEGTVVVEAAGASPGASQLPNGAMASADGGGAPLAAWLGLGLLAVSLMAGSAIALRRARRVR